MKTAMQEMLEIVKEYRDSETSPLVISRLNSVYVDILGMLEKEKEHIIEAWEDGASMMNTIIDGNEYYNETFNSTEDE